MNSIYAGAPISQNLSVRRRNPLYAISAVGAVLMIISTFLAWYVGKNFSGELSNNAMGQTSGTINANAISTGSGSAVVGLAIIVIALIFLGLSAGGFMLNRKGFAIANTVLGFLGSGFAFVLVSTFMSHAQSDTDDAVGLTGTTYNVGIGVYLMLLGVLIVFIGGIVALVKKYH